MIGYSTDSIYANNRSTRSTFQARLELESSYSKRKAALIRGEELIDLDQWLQLQLMNDWWAKLVMVHSCYKEVRWLSGLRDWESGDM